MRLPTNPDDELAHLLGDAGSAFSQADVEALIASEVVLKVLSRRVLYLAVLLPLLAGAALFAFWARRDVFREFVKRIDLSGLEVLLLFP